MEASTFREFWNSYPWYAHAYWIFLILYTILYTGSRIFFRKRTGKLIDVFLSFVIAILLLRLVWESWIQSLIITAAMILISEAGKDFRIYFYIKHKKFSNQQKNGKDNDNNVK